MYVWFDERILQTTIERFKYIKHLLIILLFEELTMKVNIAATISIKSANHLSRQKNKSKYLDELILIDASKSEQK